MNDAERNAIHAYLVKQIPELEREVKWADGRGYLHLAHLVRAELNVLKLARHVAGLANAAGLMELALRDADDAPPLTPGEAAALGGVPTPLPMPGAFRHHGFPRVVDGKDYGDVT